MFGTIRKHQTWLWAIIITVMVIGMATFTSMNKSGNGQAEGGDYGVIDGKPVTETEFRNAAVEASLSYFVRTGEWPDSGTPRPGWIPDQEAGKRAFLIRKLDELNIHGDSDSAASLARIILRQLARGQEWPMSAFEEQVLRPRNISIEDFQRFLEHDVAIEQLVSVVGASGKMVSPAEIQSLYEQEHQEVKADVIFFSSSNYLASIPEPPPAALAQFYTNNIPEYKEPDKMQVSYVRFSVTNYMADAEKQFGANLTNAVEQALESVGTNAVSLGLGATPDEQKAKIRDILLRKAAMTNAAAAAISFQTNLLSMVPPRPDNMDKLAKEKGLEVNVTKPFDKQYGPSDLQLPQQFPVSALFDLTPTNDPFVDSPIAGADGVYILGFNKFIPSHLPSLDEIRSRVIADYKNAQAVAMAQRSGIIFGQAVTNGLAQGQKFDAICAGAKMTPVQLPPFSASTEKLPEVESHMELPKFKEAALNTPVGQSTGFIPTHVGGLIVYVRQRLPIDKEKMRAELPDFAKAVRQERESEAFQIWFAKEASPSLRTMPAFQKQINT